MHWTDHMVDGWEKPRAYIGEGELDLDVRAGENMSEMALSTNRRRLNYSAMLIEDLMICVALFQWSQTFQLVRDISPAAKTLNRISREPQLTLPC